MSNPFRVNNLDSNSTSDNKKPTRYFSKKQEAAVAKAVGGKVQKNSGASTFQKSDVLTDLFTIECKTKTTNSDSIKINRAWFEKQIRECIQMGKRYSTIVFNFGPDKPYNENYYIIDEQLFQELLEHLKNKD